jgi:hemerythrin-like domain-containing protein
MKPTYELEREHEDLVIILAAMDKIACEIRENKVADLNLLSQIIGFLRIYVDQCHQEKEEKILFPALLECEISSIDETVYHLIKDHLVARHYINEMDNILRQYFPGDMRTLESLSVIIARYVTLTENHIMKENKVLFPFVERTLNKDIQQVISVEFDHIQKHQVGHEKFLEYYLLLTKLYTGNKETQTIDFPY